jgi:hypothetical protein
MRKTVSHNHVTQPSLCPPSAKLEHNPRNFQLTHLLVSRQNFVKLYLARLLEGKDFLATV